jgi:hypothetical protein
MPENGSRSERVSPGASQQDTPALLEPPGGIHTTLSQGPRRPHLPNDWSAASPHRAAKRGPISRLPAATRPITGGRPRRTGPSLRLSPAPTQRTTRTTRLPATGASAASHDAMGSCPRSRVRQAALQHTPHQRDPRPGGTGSSVMPGVNGERRWACTERHLGERHGEGGMSVPSHRLRRHAIRTPPAANPSHDLPVLPPRRARCRPQGSSPLTRHRTCPIRHRSRDRFAHAVPGNSVASSSTPARFDGSFRPGPNRSFRIGEARGVARISTPQARPGSPIGRHAWW